MRSRRIGTRSSTSVPGRGRIVAGGREPRRGYHGRPPRPARSSIPSEVTMILAARAKPSAPGETDAQNPRLKVGLLVPGGRLPQWVLTAIEAIRSSDDAQVVVTLRSAPTPAGSRPGRAMRGLLWLYL